MIGDVYFLGWDVGAWKCTGSKDALHLLKWSDRVLTSEGKFLGNLLEETGGRVGIRDLLDSLEPPAPTVETLIIAVDAVFGWPKQFSALLNGTTTPIKPDQGQRCTRNRYLYRETERFLDDHLKMGSCFPKSAVGDRIGNAGTKAQYFLNHMRSDGDCYVPPLDAWDKQRAAAAATTIIEVYPSAVKFSRGYREGVKLPNGKPASSLNPGDADDAIRAALVAACYAETIGILSSGYPLVWLPSDASAKEYDSAAIAQEGWIFTPVCGNDKTRRLSNQE
jgi:hypothetical protein